MSWATVALLGTVCGAWLKRWVWQRSHGGVLGWVRRQRYTFKMWRRRRRFKRALS